MGSGVSWMVFPLYCSLGSLASPWSNLPSCFSQMRLGDTLKEAKT